MQKLVMRQSLVGFYGLVFVLMLDIHPAKAQFLEKLEAAVRAQLESSKDEQDASAGTNQSSTDELPAPKIPATPQDSNSAPGSLPSILESALKLVPPPASEAPGSESTRRPSGDIYLGLEAEAAVGGGLGVRVTSVTQDSPAWKAGFKIGDRIKAIESNAVTDLNEMAEQLLPYKPGDTVRFFVSRGGRNLSLVAVLMDANLAAQIAAGSPPRASEVPLMSDNEAAWLGVTVNDLTASFRQQFGISVFRGAAVTNVEPGSPAADSGILAGDAIIEVAGRPVASAQDLTAWIEQARPGDTAQLMVARGFSVSPIVVQMSGIPQPKAPMRFGNRKEVPKAAVPQQPLALVPNEAKAPPPLPVAEPASATVTSEVTTSTTEVTDRERELEQQVSHLQSELAAAHQRLAELEQKLKAIANTLK